MFSTALDGEADGGRTGTRKRFGELGWETAWHLGWVARRETNTRRSLR